jgi:hypothetical protein
VTKKLVVAFKGHPLASLGMALHPHNPMAFVSFGSDSYFRVCLLAYNVEV